MRNFVVFLILAVFALEAVGQGPSKLRLSQLPDGALSGNTYTNDALGLSYQFPKGWSATADSKKPTSIDRRGDKKEANRCSKVLLRLEPESRIEGRFFPFADLLAVDPVCLDAPLFPQSLDGAERLKFYRVSDKIVKSFSYTPFISPYDNKIVPFIAQGRVIIQAKGGLVINALAAKVGEPFPKTKEPLNVKTSFTLTEANGFWVVWAYLADESSAEALNDVQVTFKTVAIPESR